MGILQRKCACGHHSANGECEACRKHREGSLQRTARSQPGTRVGSEGVPPIVHEVLRSLGQPLDTGTRTFMEPHFGHDFSRVRVHTNVRAAESAGAVNALAYTVGHNVVFADGQYRPGTADGRKLLAHELTHAVQQAGLGISAPQQSISIEPTESAFETEAEGNAHRVERDEQAPVSHQGTATTHALMRQPAPVTSSAGATSQNDIINQARLGAFVRCQIAYERLAGIGPPAPAGRGDTALLWQQQARSLVRQLFNWDQPNMDQITEIVGAMRNYLTPGLAIVRAASNDRDCGNRAGYVRNYRPPVVLCPAFFRSSPEERIRTMVHEAAHLAGIGEAVGESYCGVYDCASSCGGFSVADTWSHYVHCLSGRTPDQPMVIQGTVPRRGSRRP
jgi:hypothetical protein